MEEARIVVSRADLYKHLFSREIAPNERLIISPILELEKQLGVSTFDIRLGCEFVTTNDAAVQCLDRKETSFYEKLNLYQDDVYVPFGGSLALHPGRFVLGSVFEYINMPHSMFGTVLGKSSIGRMGILNATATGVHPGYSGYLTLELLNAGTVPVVLTPGMLIGQIVFTWVQDPTGDRYDEQVHSRFGGSTEAALGASKKDVSEFKMIKNVAEELERI